MPIIKDPLQDIKTIVVISNTSIKNNITMFIAYVHLKSNIVTKTIHHAVNVTSTKAELFAIRCRINQVVQVTDVLHIIVITDAVYSARCIFDSSSHLQSIAIAQDLRAFFKKNTHNSIKFCDCSNNAK